MVNLINKDVCILSTNFETCIWSLVFRILLDKWNLSIGTISNGKLFICLASLVVEFGRLRFYINNAFIRPNIKHLVSITSWYRAFFGFSNWVLSIDDVLCTWVWLLPFVTTSLRKATFLLDYFVTFILVEGAWISHRFEIEPSWIC